MAVQIQLRRDTAANWTSENPTLAEGEAGLETDTGKLKFGDGSTAWTGLSYFAPGGASAAWGGITGTLSDQTDLQTALDAKLGKTATVQSYSGNRTLDATNNGAYVRVTAAGTVTLPNGLGDGFQCVIVNDTASDTVELDAATTLTIPSGFEAEVVNRRAVTVIHVGSNVWHAHGALVES